MCSLASDVYSASLVAVELVSGRCVHNEQTGAREAARADELAAKAKARMTELLVFADDVPLSVTACDLLLGACTHVAPTDRPTFRMIRRACNVGGAPAEAEAKALQLIADVLANNPSLLQYQYITKLSPNVQIMLVPSNAPFILPQLQLTPQ